MAAMDGTQHDSRIPTLVTRRRILFVGRIMFLVHDDQAQIVVRQEKSGTGPQDDIGSISQG